MNLPDFLTLDPDGSIHLTGHRIGLEDVVHFYNEGESPEMLQERFPTLPLALVHRVIAFYLDNTAEVDSYVSECDRELERQRAAGRPGPGLAELRQRLEARRRAEGA